MDSDLLSAEMDISEPPGMVVNEDNFVYAAAEVFNIIAPYIDHTDASRVFSEVSAALRRAQEASAEATVLLQASEKAQRRERELRAQDANRHISRLRELQALLEARLERDAAGKAKRQFLRRRLAAETERASDLERRLAESDAERHRLEKALEEVRDEKRALSESRKSLEKEVAAAKEAIFQESKVKVEESTMRRMRSLSSELSQLRRKIRDLQAENAGLKKTLHPRPPSPSLTRANDSMDAFASLLGVSRPGEAGSKQDGENKASNRRHAAVGHHSRIDRHRDALGGIEEESMPSSQAMAGSSQRQGKDGDVPPRETPPPPVPNRWWSFFDRTSRSKTGNDERVPSQSRYPSARVSDEGLYRQGGTARGPAEAVLSAPTRTEGVSGRAVRRYSGVGDLGIKRGGEVGGSRRRGLGELPRPSSFRLASARMIEFADEDDSGAGEALVRGTALGEKKRCDLVSMKNLAVGVRAVDATAKTSGGSNGLQKVPLGGNSTALSLRDLITSGEFYPGGATRLEDVSGRATASGVALGAASEDSRSGDIGLVGHNGKSSRRFEYAGVLEGTRRELGHGLSDFPWGKEYGVKKSSTVSPTPPDMQSGRWCDIPLDSRCYHYTPSMPHKVYSDRKSSSGQKLASSLVGVPEGHERSQQGVSRSPKRSVSAPVGVLDGGSRETSDCRGTDRQESLDDFLQKLSVVTGGDVAAGGGRHGRLSELGVGKDRGVDCETGEERADAVVRV